MRALWILLDFLFPPRNTEAFVASATIESLGSHARPRAIDAQTHGLLPYRAPLVKACVVEAKFRDSEKAQRLLGHVLADHLREWSAEQAPFSGNALVIVPVPLAAARMKERGYNQTERIARLATRDLLNIRVDAGLLARVRDTLPQTSLDGHRRRENLAGAFQMIGTPDPRHTYIVFDDVLTTGTTMHACIRALEDAGATSVYAVALAH